MRNNGVCETCVELWSRWSYQVGAPVPGGTSACLESFPYWAYRFPHGPERSPTGAAGASGGGWRKRRRRRGKIPGTSPPGWSWASWPLTWPRGRAAPGHAWAAGPRGSSLLHASAPLPDSSPWRQGRSLGGRWPSGGDRGSPGSGLALRAKTWHAKQNTLSK